MSTRFCFRLTDEMYLTLTLLAQETYRSRGAILRMLLQRELIQNYQYERAMDKDSSRTRVNKEKIDEG